MDDIELGNFTVTWFSNVTSDEGQTGVLERGVFGAIDRYVTPIWYVLGIPGNVLAFSVWIQRRMRPSSGCYLAALALDECLFLIMQIFFELQTRWSLTVLQMPVLCEGFPVVFLTAQHLSPLLVLAFTAERYISVCHPFQRQRFCTTRRAVTVIAVLVSVALSINFVQAYFWQYNTSSGDCELRPSVTEAGSSSLWSVWSWVTELIVFGVVPVIILLLNVLVITETHRLSDEQRKLSVSVRLVQTRIENSDGKKSLIQSKSGCSSSPSATTFMLLAVSFYLIGTTLPVTICYALNLNFPEGSETIPDTDKYSDPVWSRHIAYNNIRTIVDEIGLSHYASNFYIYLITGRVFRRELRRLLCRKGRQQADNGYSSYHGRYNSTTLTAHERDH